MLQSDEDIAIDTETRDPLLTKRGPSWRYGEGYIAGLCLATETHQWYFPVRHLGGNNLPKETVYRFFNELLKNRNRTIYFHNAGYDLGWLDVEGLLPSDARTWPSIQDIAITEALLCEEHPSGYSLNVLSKRYLDREKNERLLNEAGQSLTLDPKKDLWKFPSQFVGPYGEEDARNTFDVGRLQHQLVEKEGVQQVHRLEMDIIPLIHLMVKTGVPIDEERADVLNKSLQREETRLKNELNFDVWSNQQVTQVLRNEGFILPRTETGGFSADKKVLSSISEGENTPAKIQKIRQLNRLRETYIEQAAQWAYKGKIYPEYRQIATDDGGTRSGRMASKHPNFQQIPKRSEIGKQIRGLYWSGNSDTLWGKFDYSSQEPRLQVHYGLLCKLDGAAQVRDAFVAGKKLYTWMEENLPGVSYDDAKMLVLARSYGMTAKTLAATMGISIFEARDLLEEFDKGVSYIPQLADMAKAKADKQGFIRTLLGRKRRFMFWEDLHGSPDEKPIFGYKNAKRKYPHGKLRRAFTYKAFNGLIQGSAADQTKAAMLQVWRETNKVPLCQVHDELDYVIEGEDDPNIKKICLIMETVVPKLLCPFKVDCDLGVTWQ